MILASSKDTDDPLAAKVFRAYAPPQVACDKLLNALKSQATTHNKERNLVETVLDGRMGQNKRTLMAELRRFF